MTLTLPPTESLTWEQAEDYIGKLLPQGKVIGVTGKPANNYPEGIYLTIIPEGEKSIYLKVGETE